MLVDALLDFSSHVLALIYEHLQFNLAALQLPCNGTHLLLKLLSLLRLKKQLLFQ